MTRTPCWTLWAAVLLAVITATARADDSPVKKPCCCEEVAKPAAKCCCETTKTLVGVVKSCCETGSCCQTKTCVIGTCCGEVKAACACQKDCCCAKGCACSKTATAPVATCPAGCCVSPTTVVCPAPTPKPPVFIQAPMAPSFGPYRTVAVPPPPAMTPAMPSAPAMPLPAPTFINRQVIPMPTPAVRIREAHKAIPVSWHIQVGGGKSPPALEICHADDSKVTCDKFALTVAEQSFKIAVVNGQVQIDGPFLKATANKIALGHGKNAVVLEGDVKLHYGKDNQQAEMKAALIVVDLVEGTIEMQGAKAKEANSLFQFHIGFFD